jgi:hypothetical protein
MNSEELRAALRGATAELETPPTFAGEVMRGGARRIRRRRLIIASVAAATALAVGGTVVAGWQTLSEPTQVATDPRLNGPTRGNLATDAEFLDDAIRAWEKELPDESNAGSDIAGRVIGRPHVYWAGDFTGDKVAMVMQATGPTGNGPQGMLRGLVGTRADTQMFGIVALAPPHREDSDDFAFRFGPGGRYVLAMELDKAQFLSTGVVYDNTGRPSRDDTWQLMANLSGVMGGLLPDSVALREPVIVAGDPATAQPEDQVPIVSGAGLPDGPAQKQPTGLPWVDPGGQSHMMWAGAEPDRWRDMGVMHQRFHEILKKSPYLDHLVPHHDGPSPWYLSVGLPGGKIATIAEYQAVYETKARIYVIVSDSPDAIVGIVGYVGPTDASKPLPVLAKLPDNAGWAAAAKGATLSYRTAVDGTWQGERAEALLAPADAVQIQVQRPGQQPATVDVR